MTKRIYDTVSERVVGALWNQPAGLTAKQLTAMYNVGSPSKEIQRLREAGVPVFTIFTKSKKGERMTKYRLSEVTNNIVAYAHQHNPKLFEINE